MKKCTKKHLELIEKINEVSFKIVEEKGWIEIACAYCENDDEDFIFKMELLLNIICERNLKLYDYVEDLLCDLNKYI